jgi:regulator of RNase E activity RraA
VSVEQICDALELLKIEGYSEKNIIHEAVIHIHPMNNINHMCGREYTVTFSDINDSGEGIGINTRDYVDTVPKNSIIIIDNCGVKTCSVWGSILTQVAITKGICGTIINGCTRDVNDIQDKPYLVFAIGGACTKSSGRYKVVQLQTTICINLVKIHPGDYIVANMSGIIVLNPQYINKILEVAEQIATKETCTSIIYSVTN